MGYYRSRYIPANVFYVIVGDINADDVVARSQAFAANKAKPAPTMLISAEPRRHLLEVVEEAPIQSEPLHYSARARCEAPRLPALMYWPRCWAAVEQSVVSKCAGT